MHTLVKVVSYQKKAIHTHLSKGCMSVSYNNKKAINTHLTEGCIVPKKSILHTISLRPWWRKPHIPISILYSNLTSPLTPSLPQPVKFWGWKTHTHTHTHPHPHMPANSMFSNPTYKSTVKTVHFWGKGFRISNLSLLLFIFKSNHSSERVNFVYNIMKAVCPCWGVAYTQPT